MRIMIPARAAILFFCAAHLPLMAQRMGVPRLGCVVSAGGAVRMVYGLRANFILGEAAQIEAVSAACSETNAVVKTTDALVVLDAEGRERHRFLAEAGAALVSFRDDGDVGHVYLTATRELLRWENEEWVKADLPHAGEILSIGERDGAVVAVERRGEELWLVESRADGRYQVLSRFVSEALFAVLLPDGSLVLAAGEKLVHRKPDGSQTEIEVPAAVTRLSVIGGKWVQVETGVQRMAVRVEGGQAEAYYLPGEAR